MWLFYMRLLSRLSQMQLQPCFCKLKWVCLTFLRSHICAIKQRKKIVLIVCKKVTAVEKGATAASRLHLLLYCIVKKIPVNFKFGSFALNWSSRANEMPQRKAMKSLPVLLAQKFCKKMFSFSLMYKQCSFLSLFWVLSYLFIRVLFFC